jgi:hypothetical protein
MVGEVIRNVFEGVRMALQWRQPPTASQAA